MACDVSRYYSNIETVKELTSIQAVNEHLRTGRWELLKLSESVKSSVESGVPVTNSTLVYVVGLVRGANPPSHPQNGSVRGNVKPCNRCNQQIYLEKNGERWIPRNSDGKPHYCGRESS